MTGTNLAGAFFSFSSGATVGSQTTNPSGLTATLQITAAGNTRGVFPLLATTANGSSTSTLNAGNQFFVFLSPDEADTQVISV